MGTKVEIRQGSRGRGQIVIHFRSHEEFERLREHLVGRIGRSRTQPRRLTCSCRMSDEIALQALLDVTTALPVA